MRGIVSIGECMLELSDNGVDWSMGHAGDTFNTLWALRAVLPEDRPTDYVSAFGDDPFSARQLAFFSENGIGIASSPRLADVRPGLYAITLDGAERSFTYWRSEAAARRLADDPAALRESLGKRALIYFSGITLAILGERARRNLMDAVTEARDAGSLVAFDPNYRERLWPSAGTARTAVMDALGVADIALPTFSDEHALFGDASPEATAARIRATGVKEILVKNGKDDALALVDGEMEVVPAMAVATPIDTTGAGDSFNGGYLAARLMEFGQTEAARLGHKLAAATVQVYGARASLPTLRDAFGHG